MSFKQTGHHTYCFLAAAFHSVMFIAFESRKSDLYLNLGNQEKVLNYNRIIHNVYFRANLYGCAC